MARGNFVRPGAERVVAIGDLHGDFSATTRAFSLAGAIDDELHWVGGGLVVVQTGDQVDRGDDDARVLSFLARLADEASQAGGRVIVLNGNHETMNVLGDFRYVTPGGLSGFGGLRPVSAQAAGFPPAYRERASAMLPGGAWAVRFAERPIIVVVGDTVFVHGGVLPQHVEYGIDRLEHETALWMRAERTTPPGPIVDPDGPLWTRLYGEPRPSAQACLILERTLDMLGVRRMVVGHTVQERGMSSACDERVFRIDVGLSKYYGDRPVQVLVIEDGRARVLTAN